MLEYVHRMKGIQWVYRIIWFRVETFDSGGSRIWLWGGNKKKCFEYKSETWNKIHIRYTIVSSGGDLSPISSPPGDLRFEILQNDLNIILILAYCKIF